MFVDEPLSWLDAVYQCKSFHGNLVAIESLEEQNYLAGEFLEAYSWIFIRISIKRNMSSFS